MDEPKKEKKSKSVEQETKIPFLVYFKAFFLIFVVVFGMFILSRFANSKQTQKKTEQSAILSTSQKFLSSLTKENIQNGIQEEMRTNETYKNTMKSVNQGTDQVLGEASKAAVNVLDESKDTVKNTVYEYTVEKMIMSLINNLPDQSKKRIEVNVCQKPSN